jgi:hypothetical protein
VLTDGLVRRRVEDERGAFATFVRQVFDDGHVETPNRQRRPRA